MVKLLYEDLTYKIRGAVFTIHKVLGSGHKEPVYHKALIEEFKKLGIRFIEEKTIPVNYNGVKVGVYRPDFVLEDKIIVELKALPFLAKNILEQMLHYLAGTKYRLGLIINFGTRRVQIRRVVYDTVRPTA